MIRRSTHRRPSSVVMISVALGIGLFLLAACGSTPGAATTTTGSVATTTTIAATTTTTPTTSTTAPATTTTTVATTTTAIATTTTSTAPFPGDTSTKTHPTVDGQPGPTLTDVRFGDHGTFVRAVFEFIGSGTPRYTIGYADPPFLGGGSGEEVPVSGAAFIEVQIQPGALYDTDTGDLVYPGDTTIDPGMSPFVQVQFIDDFETYMTWIIGLTGEKPFTVDVLQNPLRIVIDIAK